jgi:L-threonylcarbamoyladenylate synthase
MESTTQALNILAAGGILLYPTDTVWGLGCDATNAEAVNKIFEIKERDKSKPMLILVDHEAKIERYVKKVPDLAWDLIDNATNPLTIIYPEAVGLPAEVCGPDGSIAIRIVKDKVCANLIRKLNRPLLSTSANISGNQSPVRYEDIDKKLIERVDFVLRHPDENNGTGKASSIIKLAINGEIQIIRH